MWESNDAINYFSLLISKCCLRKIQVLFFIRNLCISIQDIQNLSTKLHRRVLA